MFSPTNSANYPLYEKHSHDVLLGRGGSTNNHIGNRNWRALVASLKHFHITLPKRQKAILSKSIVRAVRSQNPPGRFLEKDVETNLWYDVGDSRAIQKTAQALREGARDIRQTLVSNDDLTKPNNNDKEEERQIPSNSQHYSQGPKNNLEATPQEEMTWVCDNSDSSLNNEQKHSDFGTFFNANFQNRKDGSEEIAEVVDGGLKLTGTSYGSIETFSVTSSVGGPLENAGISFGSSTSFTAEPINDDLDLVTSSMGPISVSRCELRALMHSNGQHEKCVKTINGIQAHQTKKKSKASLITNSDKADDDENIIDYDYEKLKSMLEEIHK